jgi:hypothetical protein
MIDVCTEKCLNFFKFMTFNSSHFFVFLKKKLIFNLITALRCVRATLDFVFVFLLESKEKVLKYLWLSGAQEGLQFLY